MSFFVTIISFSIQGMPGQMGMGMGMGGMGGMGGMQQPGMGGMGMGGMMPGQQGMGGMPGMSQPQQSQAPPASVAVAGVQPSVVPPAQEKVTLFGTLPDSNQLTFGIDCFDVLHL